MSHRPRERLAAKRGESVQLNRRGREVEWGDLAVPALGESALEVTLGVPDAQGAPERRAIIIVGRGDWGTRVGEVATALQPVAEGKAL